MPKLRKMLCDIDSVECKSIMALIETQSNATLAKWAVSYAKERFLPIYNEACADRRLNEIVSECEAYLRSERKISEIKPLLREATEIARSLSDNPVLQASTRAVSVACATINTPTNSLGFLFYGAAAVAYNKIGLSQPSEEYDRIATDELAGAFESLNRVAVKDEPNPATINWNC